MTSVCQGLSSFAPEGGKMKDPGNEVGFEGGIPFGYLLGWKFKSAHFVTNNVEPLHKVLTLSIR